MSYFRPCVLCGSFAHPTEGCHHLKARKCYECGGTGHYAKECREKKAAAQAARIDISDQQVQPEIVFRLPLSTEPVDNVSDIPLPPRQQPAVPLSPQPGPSFRAATSAVRRLEFIDCHYHADLLRNAGITVNQWPTFPGCAPVFAGGIVNFTYPVVYSEDTAAVTSLSRQLRGLTPSGLLGDQNLLPPGAALGAAYGVHPKHAREYSVRVHAALDAIFSAPQNQPVLPKAVGECGLDFGAKQATYAEQEYALSQQAELAAKHNLPVVLHIKGPSDSNDSYDRKALEILGRKLSPHHRLHRHCFKQPHSVAELWLKAFPETYFGLTPCIVDPAITLAKRDCPPHLLDFATKIRLDRLVLETDAPWMVYDARGSAIATPPQALMVAERLAELRSESFEEIVEQTTANARRLYGL
ncbi:Protein Y24F12A.1 [Aphelenchoides avenae]|nr:Protein Y24F12A.1 [Aphelenchus avenae]